MDISPETISKYKIKKVLKISIFTLLFFVIGLLIFEYFRITPSNVHFSNITSSSVTVSWSSKTPVSATVIPFEGNTTFPVRLFCFFKEKFFDTRDVKRAELEAASKVGLNRDGYELSMDDFQTDLVITDAGRYYTHHVVVNGLKPEKEYSFLVGDSILYRKVSDDNNSSIMTLSVPDSILIPYPVYGVVQDAQNRKDPSIEDLENVVDGVVYFNYLDKKSGDKSNLFSSSISDNGSWYIDASRAVSQDGINFIDTYSDIDSEILVELVVDAGNKGIWKSKRHNITSPTEPFVLNMVNSISDEEEIGPVIKISSSRNYLINRIFAAPEKPSDCDTAACQFINFCGPCQQLCSNGYWYPCNCSTATLSARQCAGYEPEPENDTKCNGGYNIGDFFKDGTACYECYRVYSGTYYYAGTRRVSNDKCEPTCTPKTCVDFTDGNGQTLKSSCTTGTCSTIPKSDGCGGNLTCYSPNTPEPIKKCHCEDYNMYNTCAGNGCSGIKHNDIANECASGTFISCYEKSSCSKKTCTQKEYETICPENSTCTAVTPDDGCGGTIACWKIDGTVNPKRDCKCSDYSNPTLYDKCEGDCDYLTYWKEDSECVNGGVQCFTKKSCTINTTCSATCESAPCKTVYEDDGCGGKNICKEDDTQADTIIIPAIVIHRLPSKTKCSLEYAYTDSRGASFCTCYDGSSNLIVDLGKYCLDTTMKAIPILTNRECKDGSKEGDICRSDGTTCVKRTNLPENYNQDILYCEGSLNSKNIIDSKNKSKILSSIKNFIPEVKAEEQEYPSSPYLLDSKTGLFVNLPAGKYVAEYKGQEYALYVDTTGDSVKSLLYIDSNANGIYDEGTDTNLSSNPSVLNLIQVQGEYYYNLKTGFNFVSFPFLVETSYGANTAAALPLDLNKMFKILYTQYLSMIAPGKLLVKMLSYTTRMTFN